MNAEEARKIWETEVTAKGQVFLEFIKKRILQYTYQENVFSYAFEFPDFIKTIQADGEEEVSDEFIQGIFDKITSYFEDLGFRVKADNTQHKIWITYSKSQTLEKNSFTENLVNIIKVRRDYRTFTGIDSIISDILFQIGKKARRSRCIKYPLTLNIPNEKSLLLEDLVDIIDKLEEAGFRITLEGTLSNTDSLGNREYILKAIDAGMCFEKQEVKLIIEF